MTKKKEKKKNDKWEEVKKGRIEKGEYAIVELHHESRAGKYVVYKNGDIIGYGDDLTDTKKICEGCEKE